MITKTAQPPYWQEVKAKLGDPKYALRPEIISILNNVNQLVWDASPPAGNPNALAYVSSEDANDDGKIDKIHFVLSNLPNDPGDIDHLVGEIASTLVHEHKHIEDFDPERGIFPGGEGVAESAQSAYESGLKSRLAQSTTNNGINIDKKVEQTLEGDFKMKKELVRLANHLDKIGHRDLADRLDGVLKTAQEQDEQEVTLDPDARARAPFGVSESPSLGDIVDPTEEMIEEPPTDFKSLVVEEARESEEEGLTPAEVGDEPVDSAVDAWASNSTSDRINKMADLMSREFTTNVLGSFSR
jgi:hypothetical protein